MTPSMAHVEEQLLEFAYGELPEDGARAVRAHLEDCPQCQARLEEIQGVRRVMAKLPGTAAPSAGLESLLAYAEQAARRTRAGPVPKQAFWRRWVYPLAGAAAAVVVVFVAREANRERDLGEAVKATAQAAVESKAEKQQVPEPLQAAPLQAGAEQPVGRALEDTHGDSLAEAPEEARQQAPAEAPQKARTVRAEDERGVVANRGTRVPARELAAVGAVGGARASGSSEPAGRSEEKPRARVQSQVFDFAPEPAHGPVPAKKARQAVVAGTFAEKKEAMPAAPPAAAAEREVAKDSAVDPDEGARELVASARTARDQQRLAQAAQLLQRALSLKVEDSRLRMEVLSLSCDVQYQLGNAGAAEALCHQLASEFPGSGAAQVAAHRVAAERARAAQKADDSVRPADR